MKNSTYIQNYSDSIVNSIRSTIVTENGNELSFDDGLEKLCELSDTLQKANKNQYLIGNGASAAFADHMALDWTKNGGVKTYSFNGISQLTAIANDTGSENLFSKPLEWYAERKDLLLVISSSGNSQNIISAVNTALKKEMYIVTFTGLKPDNQVRAMGNLNFYISAKTYGIVECVHQIILHMWLDKFMNIKEWERTIEQNMNLDAYQA